MPHKYTPQDVLKKIDHARGIERDWRVSSEEAVAVFENEKDRTPFNVFWSSIKTIVPSLYSQTPKPDVRSRRKKRDPVATEAANLLEEVLKTYLDQQKNFDDAIRAPILDALITGRGVARLRYKPIFGEVRQMVPVAPDVVPDPETGMPEEIYPENAVAYGEGYAVEVVEEELLSEEVYCDPVAWDDFIIQPGKEWERVEWIGFRNFMTRSDLTERFGSKGAEVPLTVAEGEESRLREMKDDIPVEAQGGDPVCGIVYEFWCKETRKIYYLTEGYDKFLDVVDDPHRLEGFFPVPKPLYTTKVPGSLVPVSDYFICQDQYRQLTDVSRRITRLTRALKVRGIYDATINEMSHLMGSDENALIPSQSITPILESGGLDSAIWMFPIERIATVLRDMLQYRDELKQMIYEATGLSDILRGATKASETATAQQIKAQWGSIRIQEKQREVQRFIRDMLRMMAEVVSERVSPESIAVITGEMPSPQVQNLLRRDGPRSFRIDIETNSTAAGDLAEYRKNVNEYLNFFAEFMERILPLTQTGVVSVDLVKALLQASSKGYEFGKEVEDLIDQMGQQPAAGVAPGVQAGGVGVPGVAESAPPAMPGQIEALLMGGGNA